MDGLQKTKMLYLLPMKKSSLFLLLLCLLVPRVVLADTTDLAIPENKQSNEGQLAAEQSAKLFQSKEFQEKLSCEKHRLETEVFSEFIKPIKKDPKGKSSTKFLTADEKLYLFLSSSMPDETVHNYLPSIAQINSSEISPVIIVLDDYHFIRNNDIHEFFEILLHHLPGQVKIAMATRTR